MSCFCTIYISQSHFKILFPIPTFGHPSPKRANPNFPVKKRQIPVPILPLPHPLFRIKVAKIKNFEVNKNTKHPYTHELPDCETGFNFWVKPKSGNCGRFQFWAYPKVETADAFPVLGRFHFWACTNPFEIKTEQKLSIPTKPPCLFYQLSYRYSIWNYVQCMVQNHQIHNTCQQSINQ